MMRCVLLCPNPHWRPAFGPSCTALYLGILDAGILIMLLQLVVQVKLRIFSLNILDSPVSFLLLSNRVFLGCQVEGTILWVGGGGGLQHFIVSPRPLGTNWDLVWVGPWGFWD